MDSLAKQELHHVASLLTQVALPDSLQGAWWYAWTQLGKVTLDPHTQVLEVLGQMMAQHYCAWTYKQQLDDCSFHLVHW